MKWEYFVHTGSFMTKRGGENFEAELNQLGDQGWEVAGVFGEAHKTVIVIMKRERTGG